MLGLRKKIPVAMLMGLGLLAGCGDDPVEPSNDPPVGLNAVASGSTAINLTWTASTGVTQYVLERATGAAGTFAEITRPASTATSYTDTGLNPTALYRYRLAAVRSAGVSSFSIEASATTGAPPVLDVSADITANTTWTRGNIYRIQGFRKVANGATLTIESGTKIIGDFNTVGSSLFVLRGGRIVAEGTAAQPIV